MSPDAGLQSWSARKGLGGSSKPRTGPRWERGWSDPRGHASEEARASASRLVVFPCSDDAGGDSPCPGGLHKTVTPRSPVGSCRPDGTSSGRRSGRAPRPSCTAVRAARRWVREERHYGFRGGKASPRRGPRGPQREWKFCTVKGHVPRVMRRRPRGPVYRRRAANPSPRSLHDCGRRGGTPVDWSGLWRTR
jgi:hypothetical protein